MLTGIASVSIAYISYLAFLYLSQNKLIFIGAKPNHLTYKKLEALSEDILSDQTKLQGWRFSGAEPDEKTVIIFFGGNAQDVAHMIPYLGQLKTSSIYTYNYRKYGLSEGQPDELSLYIDSISIYNHVKQNNPDKKVFIIGQSLGTAIAGYLSAQKQATKLVLISPLSSIYNIARERFYYTIPKFLIKNNLNLLDHAKSLNSKTLVIIGSLDNIIPVKHSIATYNQISSDKTLLELSAADHNNILEFEETLTSINDFLLQQ